MFRYASYKSSLVMVWVLWATCLSGAWLMTPAGDGFQSKSTGGQAMVEKAI